MNDFPEYRDPSWNTPVGYVMNDQRHKVRAWLSYLVPMSKAYGSVNIGVVQRFDSALPYDASGPSDPRPYVTNPGYLTPPSTVTYVVAELARLTRSVSKAPVSSQNSSARRSRSGK